VSATGVVFDVQRFAIHDGPGIRTVIFFKGCSLRCPWCHNPESQRPRPELGFWVDRCIDCDRCAWACPRGAIVPLAAGLVDRDRCDDCGLCQASCPAGALRMIGRTVTVDQLAAECAADLPFATASWGGVTLSGGEPVLQSGFAAALLARLRGDGFHTLLETAGAYPWRLLAPLLPHLDEIYFDWKLPVPGAYAAHLGGDGDRVLANLARLVADGAPVTVRVPLVPGLDTAPVQVAAMAATLAGIGVTELRLLGVHDLWRTKLPRLRPLRDHRDPPPAAEVDRARVIAGFAAAGIRARPA